MREEFWLQQGFLATSLDGYRNMKKFEKGREIGAEGGKTVDSFEVCLLEKISKGNINIWLWFMVFYHKCDTSLV